MTDNEYSEQLLEKAKEISFQMEVCLQDITWIQERIKILHDKVLTDPFGNQDESIKELEFLTRKMNINMETRAKLKEKNHRLGLLINGFFGKEIWKDLP